jgi:hypothetical protein
MWQVNPLGVSNQIINSKKSNNFSIKTGKKNKSTGFPVSK